MKSVYYILMSFLFLFCNKPEEKTTYPIEKKDTTVSVQKHPKFNTYWNTGKAEITSYALTQSRYGQIHQGTAVNIFVTEEFLPNKQVKADNQDEHNISILKLNSTKKFVTGIYPYSLMTSTFTPIYTSQKAIKISFSSQEWCGNTFVQLNNRAQFEIDFRSYFETNADKKIVLTKNILENDLWNLLRINPKKLPTGNFNSIPSFEFLALNHQKIAAYQANASLKEEGDFITYSIYYPSLKRELIIKATKKFPFTIENWKETFTKNGKENTSEATKIKTIQAAYWNKKRVTDTKERTLLGL